MPIRAFVSQDLNQLKATLALLDKALMSGSLEELRVAGIMTRTGGMKMTEVQLRYQQCRYELYLRVKCMDPKDDNTASLQAQYTNPYIEKAMKVHSRSSVGLYGDVLPAPFVPPTP